MFQIASRFTAWKHVLWISSFMWELLTLQKEVRAKEAKSLKTHHSIWTYLPESA